MPLRHRPHRPLLQGAQHGLGRSEDQRFAVRRAPGRLVVTARAVLLVERSSPLGRGGGFGIGLRHFGRSGAACTHEARDREDRPQPASVRFHDGSPLAASSRLRTIALERVVEPRLDARIEVVLDRVADLELAIGGRGIARDRERLDPREGIPDPARDDPVRELEDRCLESRSPGRPAGRARSRGPARPTSNSPV